MPEIPNQKIVVFDFDGTIAKTDGLLLEIYNKAAPALSLKPLAATEVPAIQEMKTKQVLKYLNIPWYKMPALWREMTGELALHRKEITLHAGIPELLAKLKEKDIPFGVISSNSVENIEAVFIQNNLPKPLFIGCSSAIFKKHKVYSKCLKQHKFKLKHSIYVGDEVRDIELGTKLSLPVISVSWGFATKSSLLKTGVSTVCDTVSELENELNHFLSR